MNKAQDLPDGWEIIELKDVFEIKKGKKVKIEETIYDNSIPYIGIRNLRGNPIAQFANDENGLTCEENDILLVWDGANCGTVGSGLSGYVGSTIARLRLINDTSDSDYILHFLKSKFHYFNSNTTGATIPHLDKKRVHNLKIPLPPLPTQKKIVAILEKAEKLKGWRREADELTDELLKSTFLQMFGDPVKNPKGWEIKKLKETSDKFSDGPFGSNLKTEHYRNNGIRVIRLQNIGVNEFLDKDKVYVSEKHYSNLKKHSCVPGDIIIGTMGSPNLRACILPKSIELAINKADCIQCRPNKNLATSEYLCQLLNLPSTLIIASNMIHGQTRSRLSMGNLSTLSIPIPPLELQKQFSNVVQQIEELQEYQSQTKLHITDLFSSFMQQAFKGELKC